MADLAVSGFLGRMSLLAADEALVILEHNTVNDRVVKILYENIESIIVWKSAQALKMSLALLLLGGPALASFWAFQEYGEDAWLGLAVFLGVILAAIEMTFLIRPNYHLRINHGGEAFNVSTPAFPWRLRRFVEKMKARTETVQRELRAKRDQAQSAQREPV